MKLKAVIFDLGETLLNYGAVDVDALFLEGAKLTYAYLEGLGGKLPMFGWYFRRHIFSIKLRYFLSNIVDREFDCAELLDKHARRMGFSLNEDQLRELAWLWYRPLGQCATIEENLAETLERLQGMGLKLGIISNTFLPGSLLDRQLDIYGIRKYFPIRIYSSDTLYRKPNRRIYERALEATGVKAGSAMMVGDKVREDIRGSMRCGMQAVYKRGVTNRQKRIPDGVREIERISELPGLIEEIHHEGHEGTRRTLNRIIE